MELIFKKTNITTILLFITLLAMENFAELIPTTTYLIPGLLKFSDIGVIMAFGWTLWVYLNYRRKKKVKYKYGMHVVVFFMLIIISSFMANEFFAQPVSYGIRSLRYQMVSFLLYFPITRSLQTGSLKQKDLVHIIFIIGTFELMVYTSQYFLADKVQFTYININLNDTRYNSLRLRFPYLLPLIMSMFCINDILNSKKHLLRNIIYIIWSAFLIMFICKHRAPSILLIATWGAAFLLWKKKIVDKSLIGIMVIAIAIGILSNVPIVQDSIFGLKNISSEQNLTIRKAGQAYYIAKLQKSPWFGFGAPNENCAEATFASGYSLNYLLADNGIFGFYYCFGAAGIIWIVSLWLKSYRYAFTLFQNKKYQYLLYFIFETGNLYMGMHWFYYYTLPFIIILTLLDFDYTSILKKEGTREIEN